VIIGGEAYWYRGNLTSPWWTFSIENVLLVLVKFERFSTIAAI